MGMSPTTTKGWDGGMLLSRGVSALGTGQQPPTSIYTMSVGMSDPAALLEAPGSAS